MGNSQSDEAEATSKQDVHDMPDFNHIFANGLPKMMQASEDLNRMSNYIMDLRNMLFGVILLSIFGILMFLILKWRNDKEPVHRVLDEESTINFTAAHSHVRPPFRTYPQRSSIA